MTKSPESFDDLVITFKPDATPEAKAQFIAELASAILVIARHQVTKTEDNDLDASSLETGLQSQSKAVL